MRITSNIKSVSVNFWECIGEADADALKMFDFCEGLDKNIYYDIDKIIHNLEDAGKTRAKNWMIQNDNSTEGEGFELKVNFENGFFICFNKNWIEGKFYD